MKKKFAFLLMGGEFDPVNHQSEFETEKGITAVYTVRDFTEACETVRHLDQQGYGAVELCGAFGPERARQLIELTGGRMAVGFVTHFPEQDALIEAFFCG